MFDHKLNQEREKRERERRRENAHTDRSLKKERLRFYHHLYDAEGVYIHFKYLLVLVRNNG
jgi:hypothetical protein